MSAHKNTFQTSDFITLILVTLFLFLEFILPTDLRIDRLISINIGILLAILSWTVIFTAKYQFKKHSQKSGPGNETTRIIKTGLFSYTRNPIYLGVIFLVPALGFVINSVWLLLTIFPSFILIEHFLIIPEERYLQNKFGDEYRKYCDSVRRWI